MSSSSSSSSSHHGKMQLGPRPVLHPMPALLIGARVEDRANFMLAAWGGVACGEPPMLSVSIRPGRFTLQGILQTRTFSVNVPSADMMREADYCGLVSGAKDDTKHECGDLAPFAGTLETAPLAGRCPLCLECVLVQYTVLGSHALVVGEVRETWADEAILTDGLPDVAKLDPLVYAPGAEKHYRRLGERLGRAFSVGRELMQQDGSSR